MFRIKQVFIVFWASVLCATASFSQSYLESLNKNRNNLERKGMLTLTAWSGVNIITGSIGWITTSEESAYFHQMNAGWNIVNLGLGLSGYFRAKRENYAEYDLYSSIASQRKVSNAFLFNTALNGTYITTGFLLKERAKHQTDQAMMLRGFGNSLILQGGFLLLFDATSFILHNRNRKKHLDPVILELSSNRTEIGMVIRF
jgi:hypothetical protein